MTKFSLLTAIFFLIGIALQANEPSGSYRIPQFENEHVKVWRTVVLPNQPLKMHRHDCARVIVGLKGGSLTKLEETGETSQLVFENDCAYWYEADPEGERHADLNETNQPIEVMVIEVKSAAVR